MALPLLELPPIEKGRPVAGRPFCVVEKWNGLGCLLTSRRVAGRGGECGIQVNGAFADKEEAGSRCWLPTGEVSRGAMLARYLPRRWYRRVP